MKSLISLSARKSHFIVKNMETGTIGIIKKDIFDKNSTKFIHESYAYLTTANKTTVKPKDKKSYSKKTIFEIKYVILEKSKDFRCSALYLSEVCIPNKVVAVSTEYKFDLSTENTWKYYKVILTVDDKVETVFVHENCLNYFTWFNRAKTSFREPGSI